jgi:hypothetical protein
MKNGVRYQLEVLAIIPTHLFILGTTKQPVLEPMHEIARLIPKDKFS